MDHTGGHLTPEMAARESSSEDAALTSGQLPCRPKSGAARFTHEQMKEACLHYDAFDAGNFAVYFKSLSGEVAGTKGTGYTLTPRGLANATEVVKSLIRS